MYTRKYLKWKVLNRRLREAYYIRDTLRKKNGKNERESQCLVKLNDVEIPALKKMRDEFEDNIISKY